LRAKFLGHSEIYVNGLTRLHEILKFVPLKPNASRDIFEITLNHKRDTVNLLPLYRDGDIYSSPLLKPNSCHKGLPGFFLLLGFVWGNISSELQGRGRCSDGF
jgi:hypothetical protein